MGGSTDLVCITKIQLYDKVMLCQFIDGSGFSHARRLDDGSVMSVKFTVRRIVMGFDVLPERFRGVALERILPSFLNGWKRMVKRVQMYHAQQHTCLLIFTRKCILCGSEGIQGGLFHLKDGCRLCV